jgi:hypothetical protein
MVLVAPPLEGSSWIRDQTQAFCIDRQTLYYCASWEVLMVIYPPQLSEIRKENSVGEKKLKYEIESFSQ